jgi:hypothetical protein
MRDFAYNLDANAHKCTVHAQKECNLAILHTI